MNIFILLAYSCNAIEFKKTKGESNKEQYKQEISIFLNEIPKSPLYGTFTIK